MLENGALQKLYIVVIGFLLCVSHLNLARCTLFALAPCLLQESLQPFLPGLLTTLQDQVERVEERVDGGVDQQHEDGHGHVDLTGDRNTARCQHSQQTDGKPAQEVRGCHGGESAGDHQIFRCLTAARWLHGVRYNHPLRPDRHVDESLNRGDDEEDDKVQHDRHAERVIPSWEIRSGYGQRNAYPRLAIEVPVRGERHQKSQGQQQAHAPRPKAGRMCRPSLEAVVGERESDHDGAVQGDETDDECWHFTWQEGQETGHLARNTVLPDSFLPETASRIHCVRYANDSQVDPHDEVGHVEVQHEDDETLFLRHTLEEDAVDETTEVAQ